MHRGQIPGRIPRQCVRVVRFDQGVDCTPLRLGILMAYEEDVLDDVDGIMVHERLRHRCTILDEELRTLVVVAFGCELERRCARARQEW